MNIPEGIGLLAALLVMIGYLRQQDKVNRKRRAQQVSGAMAYLKAQQDYHNAIYDKMLQLYAPSPKQVSGAILDHLLAEAPHPTDSIPYDLRTVIYEEPQQVDDPQRWN
jgi:hypothetical protein